MIDENTPTGTAVIVSRENGADFRTKTKAKPMWLVLRARPRRGVKPANTEKLVVLVEGLTGAYDCAKVRLVPEKQLELFGGCSTTLPGGNAANER